MTRPLLIVRPEPGNAETRERAAALGLDARGLPLFQVRALDWQAPDPALYVGILLTSANALRLSGEKLASYVHLPAFAVGGATAELARGAGFASVIEGDTDVSRLMGKIATLGLHRILHLSGADIRPFDPFGVAVDRAIIYAAEPVDPPGVFFDWIGEGPVMLVHSPRAGSRIAELVPPDARHGVALVAISASAAAAAGEGWEEVAIADEPRDEALLEVAAKLCR